MRKLLLILCFIILSVNFAAVLAAAPSTLDKIETSLFGFTYPNETETLRLNRIEEQVYGGVKSGSSTQRLAKLDKDLAAGSIGKEIPPKEDTFADEPEQIASTGKKNATIPAQSENIGPGVDYPAVNELEQIVFNKDFKNKDLNSRLAQLEQKTLKKTYANDDLSTRVDRLKAGLKPDTVAKANNFFDDDGAVTLPRNYNVYQPPVFEASKNPKKANLSAIENSMFSRSYADDELESRLARVENGMFGTTFERDSQQERIERLSSAYKAQKSTRKYDSNKFAQHASTGMQIGMFILMVLACIL